MYVRARLNQKPEHFRMVPCYRPFAQEDAYRLTVGSDLSEGRMLITRSLVVVLLILASALIRCKGPEQPSDPDAQFAAALSRAKSGQRRVLIVFGADWCPDCHALEARMQEEPLMGLVRAKYEVVKVDVCRYDCNLAFARRFGNPIARGIPALVVTDSAGKVLVTTNNGEFSKARRMPKEAMLDFFKQYSGG